MKNEDTTEVNTDPFTSHFNYEMSATLALVFAEKEGNITKQEWPSLGTLDIMCPVAKQDSTLALVKKTQWSEFCLEDNLMKSCETSDAFKCSENLSLQHEIFSIISTYRDFHYTGQTHVNCEAIRSVYCLHVLNHVLKTRAKIAYHDTKPDNVNEEYRDQGFTRPTVLILVPFKESCLRVVNMLSSLLQEYSVLNKNTFQEQFSSKSQPPRKKPADHRAVLSGNTGDDFNIGIRFRNQNMELYASFYKSDVIIASPKSLGKILCAKDERKDSDFLSSIEIFIIDQADVLLIQGFPHSYPLTKYLNLQPKKYHNWPIFKVSIYALDGLSKFYRQTVIFSATDDMDHRGLSNLCYNHEGSVMVVAPVRMPSIRNIFSSIAQVFHRYESNDLVKDSDNRFKFFVKILPRLISTCKSHTLIYIPVFYDLLRIRKLFHKNKMRAIELCAHTESKETVKARNMFFIGQQDFMLYTEEFHFLHRYTIRGVENVIFYKLPSYPSFYSEICNFVQDVNLARQSVTEFSCHVLFSKFDCQRLQNVIGFEKTSDMLNSSKEAFVLRSE